MRPVVVKVGPLQAASANGIVTSVTPTVGQSLTLTTSPFAMDQPRRVLVTYGAEGSARTLTLTGTGVTGQTQSETITVPTTGTTVASVLDYATVTSIVSNSAFTNAITVGTNGVAASPWVRFDEWANPSVTAQMSVSGTANYTVQVTNDDPNSNTNPVALSAMTWVNWTDTIFQNQTASFQSLITGCPLFARILLNSGSGSVTGTFVQTGVVPW